jgi:hypothetical protein
MAFRSGLEEKVADLLVNLGVKYEYESTKVPYILQCNYTPDFLLPNGVYLETKGQLTEEDRRKMKAVKAANPELDIRFVFQAPFNKIYKGSKTTYAKWAEKHGFLWCAFHSIPIEWLTAENLIEGFYQALDSWFEYHDAQARAYADIRKRVRQALTV